MSYKQIKGLRVVVDNVSYMPTLHAPAEKPRPFIYYVTIHNDSDQTIQILGRKWMIEESDHDLTVVEGDGVIGHMPILAPGKSFNYNSYHVIAFSASASGAFYGVTMDGIRIMVEIPPFEMELPITD